jgi:hypothetical protein
VGAGDSTRAIPIPKMSAPPKVTGCIRAKTGLGGRRKYGVYLRLDSGRMKRIQYAATAAEADRMVRLRARSIPDRTKTND